MDIQKKIETERFVRELLAELDKMSREELEDFRPKMLREMRRTGRLHKKSEEFLKLAFDYVIHQKCKQAALSQRQMAPSKK